MKTIGTSRGNGLYTYILTYNNSSHFGFNMNTAITESNINLKQRGLVDSPSKVYTNWARNTRKIYQTICDLSPFLNPTISIKYVSKLSDKTKLFKAESRKIV